MNDNAFWLQIIDTSATMMGFDLVIIGLIIGGHGEKKLSPPDARSLMYGSSGSLAAFVFSLAAAVFISRSGLTAIQLAGLWSIRIADLGIIYFGMGFAVIIVTLSCVILDWIKQSG